MLRASTGAPPSVAIVTFAGARFAACTNNAAGRACNPSLQVTTTARPHSACSGDPPGSLLAIRPNLRRRVASRALSGEMASARRRGVEVLLVRPGPVELRLHGLNLMRPDGLDGVARAAYESTCRLLGTDRFRHAFAA